MDLLLDRWRFSSDFTFSLTVFLLFQYKTRNDRIWKFLIIENRHWKSRTNCNLNFWYFNDTMLLDHYLILIVYHFNFVLQLILTIFESFLLEYLIQMKQTYAILELEKIQIRIWQRVFNRWTQTFCQQ